MRINRIPLKEIVHWILEQPAGRERAFFAVGGKPNPHNPMRAHLAECYMHPNVGCSMRGFQAGPIAFFAEDMNLYSTMVGWQQDNPVGHYRELQQWIRTSILHRL